MRIILILNCPALDATLASEIENHSQLAHPAAAGAPPTGPALIAQKDFFKTRNKIFKFPFAFLSPFLRLVAFEVENRYHLNQTP